jgi:hypothetical protein
MNELLCGRDAGSGARLATCGWRHVPRLAPAYSCQRRIRLYHLLQSGSLPCLHPRPCPCPISVSAELIFYRQGNSYHIVPRSVSRRLTMILQNLVSDPAPRLTTCFPPSFKNLSTTKSSAMVRWCVPTLISGGFRGVTPRLGPAPGPNPAPTPVPTPAPGLPPGRDAPKAFRIPVGWGRGGL